MKNPITVNIVLAGLCLTAAGPWAEADIPVQNTDADILGVLSVIDENEITTAQLAQEKDMDKNVLDFARMLAFDHSKHLDETKYISQTLGLSITDNLLLQKMRTDATQERGALEALDGNDFAQLFIADIIKHHSEALNWLEQQNSQNQEITDFINKTRGQLAMHLKAAQKIQAGQTPGQV
jgi:putative membrane protein